jgi:hypothetical protein
LGIHNKMWDLGEGMGSREIADKTYAIGLENHKFINRSALPLTTDDKLTLAKAKQAQAAADSPEVPGVQGGDNTSIPSPENGKTETVSSTS